MSFLREKKPRAPGKPTIYELVKEVAEEEEEKQAKKLKKSCTRIEFRVVVVIVVLEAISTKRTLLNSWHALKYVCMCV